MSTALDEFELALVNASRALSAAKTAAGGSGQDLERLHHLRRARRRGSAPSLGASRSRSLARARKLSVALQLGLALTSVSALAAGGVAGYLLLAANDKTHTLAAFECEVQRSSEAGIDAVTGSPRLDCATAWPQATGGRAAAPPLAVWGTAAGKEVAVVRPASWGPPRRSHRWRWRRLPASWTVDLRVVALSDQLHNISLSPEGVALDLGGCAHADDVAAIVHSLLREDGLESWHVVVKAFGARKVSTGCAPLNASVLAGTKTVELLQGNGQASRSRVTPRLRRLEAEQKSAHHGLLSLYMQVNRKLADRCESVSAAAALWSRDARLAGFSPTTLAFWRAANSGKMSLPGSFFRHYTLYRQPSTQHTGNCARVLVMIAPGSGLASVYAARIKAWPF